MYKLEIFRADISFAASFLISGSTPLSMDYLALDSFDVDIPHKGIAVQKGDYCRVSRLPNTVVADFVVSDVGSGKDASTISLRPLVAVLDREVFCDGISDCAAWIAQAVRDNFIDTGDALQNIPATVTNQAAAASRPIVVDGDICGMVDVLSGALTTYRIVVNAQLDMAARMIVFEVRESAVQATIEADLGNVIDKDITLGDSYGSANKFVARRVRTVDNVVTVLGQKAFYLHADGSVDDADRDRITPVFCAIASIEDAETWEADALAAATEKLTPAQFDNEIKLDYSRADKIVQPEALPIGTEATIYTGGQAYRSLLTGREWEGGVHRLIFGLVRTDLTKKIILNRRAGK